MWVWRKNWNLRHPTKKAPTKSRKRLVREGRARRTRRWARCPSIHIGVNGKGKESEVSGEIAMRLMDDVWKILGIKPPAKKELSLQTC